MAEAAYSLQTFIKEATWYHVGTENVAAASIFFQRHGFTYPSANFHNTNSEFVFRL